MIFKKDYRYGTNMLFSELELLKCKDIHSFFLAVFVFKQQHCMLPSIFKDYYKVCAERGTRPTRQSNDLYVKKYRTTGGQKSSKYVGAKIWNGLDDRIKESTSVSVFKKSFKRKILMSYNDP